jgi:hypothetical protein
MSSAGGAPAPDTEPGTAVPVTAAEVGASVRWSYAAAAATGVVQLLLAAVLTRLLSDQPPSSGPIRMLVWN